MKEDILKFYLENHPFSEGEKNKERYYWLSGFLSDFWDNYKNEITEKWVIESVDRYFYLSGRFSKTYVELTYWYNPITFEKKETKRHQHINDGENYKLEDWAKSCEYRRYLNYDQ